MSQHDMNIANADGATVRADINNALGALVTQSSGATAPATTFAFQYWADTTTNILKIRNATNSAWLNIASLTTGEPYSARAPVAAGGTADAITADFSPDITLSNGQTVIVRATAANTTTTPTFAPDGLTAKTIVKGANTALAAGDIAGSGHWLEMNFDTTLDKWVLQNPAYGVLTASTPAIKAQSPLGIAASTTLDSSHVGRPLYYSGASAGILTLPASPVAGDAITVYAVGTGNCTIQRNGSQTIYAQGQSAVTSIVLNTGASVTVIYDGSAWVQAVGNNSIGYGQTWQTVTGSRALGTTYYNTTGRPILVSVVVAGASSSTTGIDMFVDGVATAKPYVTSVSGGSNVIWAALVIPPGSSYSANLTGSGGSLNLWRELR